MLSSYDILIIGAGPAGLSSAVSFARLGMQVAVLERLPEEAIAHPKPDGRDIALTHLSIRILEDLGMWQHIPAEEVSDIQTANVLNGGSPFILQFDAASAHTDALGFLVSNHIIRKAAYDAAKTHANIHILANADVSSVSTDDTRAQVTLKSGEQLQAPLLIAADSRFSDSRRMMGIQTDMLDFGRTILVFRMRHEKPHHHVAHECFRYGYTLAVLPLNGNLSSVVLTLKPAEAKRFMEMTPEEIGHEITQRFENKLGAMTLAGERYAYPLMAVYAKRFAAKRYALVGDAAVGMHPVTAHGFNFGLRGQNTLAEAVKKAVSLGLDYGSETVLAEYHAAHTRATKPLYLTTNHIVRLYTTDSPHAKLLRNGLMMMANRVLPAKRFLTQKLTELDRNRSAVA